MIHIAKYIIILFGLFLIGVGLLMLFRPKTANHYLRKAASTPMINYFEITIRMIPAAALVIYSDLSKYPDIFRLLGWFMIATSVVLYFVPRRIHHNYALWCADLLKPLYIRMISPFSMFFGAITIDAVI